MTSEQYRSLLLELARVSALSDACGLLDHGRLNIGQRGAVLVHDPGYDPELLQVRMNLGGFEQAQRDAVLQALLETNYREGWGGDCIFSLAPGTGEVALTMRVHLSSSLTAQELWQALSGIARHAGQMWDEIHARALPAQGLSAPGDAGAGLWR